MRLETKRLILRELSEEDAEPMKKLINSNPQISKNTQITPDQSLESHLDYIKKTIQWEREGTEFVFAILYKKKFIGVVSIYKINKTPSGIGFWIGKNYQSKGLMTEAVEKVIEFAKKKNVKVIETNVYEWNLSSMKVLEKVGFKKTGKGTHTRKWDNKKVPESYFRLEL